MRILVTGSSGHLGEALMRLLPMAGMSPVGLDLIPGPFTAHQGSITDAAFVANALAGCAAVIHTATLHKPHVETHRRADFVETNVTGTLVLLEAARAAGIQRFVFTSTTSAFGAALTASPDAPAVWIDEDVNPIPKNIYGATKTSAETLCHLFARTGGPAVVVLRTSRFFPEEDHSRAVRAGFADANAKANEYLYRRVDLEDAATAHLAAIHRAPDLGFETLIVSATTPFQRADCARLRTDPAAVVKARFPHFPRIYAAAGFRMAGAIGRVYDNARARRVLRWEPVHGFAEILARSEANQPLESGLAAAGGRKGYHATVFEDGLYRVA